MLSPSSAAADRVAALHFVHSADLSPDGANVVWTRTRVEGSEDVFELLHSRGSDPEPVVLLLDHCATDPAFSPDGQRVAYLSGAIDGPRQVALLDLATGATKELTSLPQGVADRPLWSPDGSTIAFTVGPEPVDRSLPYRITRGVPWRDEIGLVDDALNDVHVLRLDDGCLRRLTDEQCLIDGLRWAPDGRRLTFLASSAHDDTDEEVRLCQVDLAGAVSELAAPTEFSGAVIADGLIVATTAGPTLHGCETLGRLVTVDSDGAIRLRSGHLDVNGDIIADLPVPFADPTSLILIHRGDALVRVQVRDRLEVHRVSLTGPHATSIEVSTPGCVYPLALRGDHLLYACGDLLTAPDLWVRDLETGTSTRITDTDGHNRGVLTPLRERGLWAQAEGGPSVQATFIAPIDASGPLPTVLIVHGGPESAFGRAQFLDAHVLCEAGMAVLLVNPRGSRGYGHEFMTSIRGAWGGPDASDLMAALDLVIERGWADPARLGVAGLSYGGYMTTWLIGVSNRFRAAVAENPVTNFLSFQGTSDIGPMFTPQLMGGPVETEVDQYLRSSPITHVAGVRTPTLLIVGEEDHRCPPEQALQYYARLRGAGCEAELLMLPGAAHAGSVNGSAAIRRAQNEALASWLSSHLLGSTT